GFVIGAPNASTRNAFLFRDPDTEPPPTGTVSAYVEIFGGTDPLNDIAKIVSNGSTTYFLAYDGRVYHCGSNAHGELTLSATTVDSADHPSPVSMFSHALDVAIGDDCYMILEKHGDIYIGGLNAHGSVGDGTTTGPRSARAIIQNAGSGVFCGGNSAFI